MDLLDAPLATAEFLVVDTETNGKGGDACELTEIGAVLVGGGELHERWETLVGVRAPLSRGIQRFTGITQSMVDEAPPPEQVLPALAEQLEGRILVAHSARFDVGPMGSAPSTSGPMTLPRCVATRCSTTSAIVHPSHADGSPSESEAASASAVNSSSASR